MKKSIIILLFLFLTTSLIAQQFLYVNADNGLIVREFPDINSTRNGKLAYRTRIRVVQETNVELTIKN